MLTPNLQHAKKKLIRSSVLIYESHTGTAPPSPAIAGWVNAETQEERGFYIPVIWICMPTPLVYRRQR